MAVFSEISVGQYTVRGISLAGIETCLHVPQLDVMFDVGHCPRSSATVKHLFITHGHGDHSGGLLGMLSVRMLLQIHEPLKIYVPHDLVDGLSAAIRAYESFQPLPYRWEIMGVEAEQEIAIGQKQFVRPFKSYHVVNTLGYTVWERVKKLKPEFSALSGPEIAQRKQSGEPLFNTVERPLVSFCGDTTIKVVDQQPHLLQSRVLLLETTYIDNRRSVAQCRKHGHIHLDEVLERAEKFQNEHLVFTHFSQGYRIKEIHKIVNERCRDRFTPQIHPFVPKSGTWPG